MDFNISINMDSIRRNIRGQLVMVDLVRYISGYDLKESQRTLNILKAEYKIGNNTMSLIENLYYSCCTFLQSLVISKNCPSLYNINREEISKSLIKIYNGSTEEYECVFLSKVIYDRFTNLQVETIYNDFVPENRRKHLVILEASFQHDLIKFAVTDSPIFYTATQSLEAGGRFDLIYIFHHMEHLLDDLLAITGNKYVGDQWISRLKIVENGKQRIPYLVKHLNESSSKHFYLRPRPQPLSGLSTDTESLISEETVKPPHTGENDNIISEDNDTSRSFKLKRSGSEFSILPQLRLSQFIQKPESETPSNHFSERLHSVV